MQRKSDLNIFNPKAEDKICLIIYGNLAAGKTSFASAIKKLLPNYKYVCLDEIRIQTQNKYRAKGSLEREAIAKEECKKQILSAQLLIYETTGNSQLFDQLNRQICRQFKTFFIYIKCPDYECRKRFETRRYQGYYSVSPPVQQSMSISECCTSNQYAYTDMKKDLELNSFIYSVDEIVNQFNTHFHSD